LNIKRLTRGEVKNEIVTQYCSKLVLYHSKDLLKE